MGEQLHQKLKTEFKFSEDRQLVTRIKRIGDRIAQVSDRQDYQYHFFVIAKDELNAFTIPGGKVYIFTGLIDKLKTDDAIASVLAHEVGHCAARHTIKKFQAGLTYNMIGTIVFDGLLGQHRARQIAALSTNVVMSLVFSAYSRQDELEADRLGVKYMDLAGYRLDGIIDTFEVLKEGSKGANVPVILRSHPLPETRIVAAKKEIEKINAENQQEGP